MQDEFKAWRESVDVKLDRLLNDVEFIKLRVGTYLGRNEAITYLADETPIFVNTDDFGCPINFINGGRYEEDYFHVFLSFRRPGLPMLDIGANLGVYSLRMANYLRSDRIFAFEPITRIRELFLRSAFLNGCLDRISIYPYALSDHDGEATLHVPEGHAGGASLEGGGEGAKVEIKRLDGMMEDGFRCGLVKLDVEGHELSVLRGMRQILARSDESVVMFEKLAPHSGVEAGIHEYFTELGRAVYYINGRTLECVDVDDFANKGGYFIGTSASLVQKDGPRRDFFYIYPQDLNVIHGVISEGVLEVHQKLEKGSMVFHGPYWWLPRGYYRMTINGVLSSDFVFELSERFGYKTASFQLKAGSTSIEFPVLRDLIKFEWVMWPAATGETHASIERIKMEKLA
jgi:FkbM family methyltransferase